MGFRERLNQFNDDLARYTQYRNESMEDKVLRAIANVKQDSHRALDNVLTGRVDKHTLRNLHEMVDEKGIITENVVATLEKNYPGIGSLLAIDREFVSQGRRHDEIEPVARKRAVIAAFVLGITSIRISGIRS